MTTRDGFTVLIVAVVAAAHTGACAGRAATDASDRDPKAVRLVAVESASDAEATTYSAIIAPNAQVDLAFRTSGYVVEVRQTRGADGRIRALEPGAALARGVVLARVRTSDYRAVVDKAQGAHDESSAAINVAEAGLSEARAAFTQADSDFSRVAVLWQQESVTKPAYDVSKARLDAARAKVDAATAGVAAAKRRAAAAKAQLQEAQIALDDTDLHAPFDGVLVERHVDVGTLASPALPAFTVADLHIVKARFSVPDTALHLFHAGMPLPLTIDAIANERFHGQVLSVAPAADPKARSFEIAIAIDNPAMKLRSGMIASIRVADEGADRRLVRIPIDALVHDPAREQYLVYTLEENGRGRAIVKAIYVRPGPLVGNQVSVLEGLSAGQRIVGSGANLLRPGDVAKEIQ